MLDLARLHQIKLSPRPVVQRIVASAILAPNYARFPGIDIVFEHQERLPDHPVIYAMNHTDRFNYFPFQFKLWRDFDRYTTTWVKGKYFEQERVAKFMQWTNNLPTVSRGYIITKDFLAVMGRRPNEEEYAALRKIVDTAESETGADHASLLAKVPQALLETERDVLGVPFVPARQTYGQAINQTFHAMMSRFVDLHKEAFDKGLDLLIFPQGTRSIRMSRGHTGIAQIALRFKKCIVPIGCSGSDLVYPGSRPWGKKGRIVYRFGEPIEYQDMKPWHIEEPYHPFSREAEHKYNDRFQGLVDYTMARINELVDPEYQFDDSDAGGRVQGTDRFV